MLAPPTGSRRGLSWLPTLVMPAALFRLTWRPASSSTSPGPATRRRAALLSGSTISRPACSKLNSPTAWCCTVMAALPVPSRSWPATARSGRALCTSACKARSPLRATSCTAWRLLWSSVGTASGVCGHCWTSPASALMRASGSTPALAGAAPTTMRDTLTSVSASSVRLPSPTGRCSSGASALMAPDGASSANRPGAWLAMSLLVLRGSCDGASAVRVSDSHSVPVRLVAASDAWLSSPVITSLRAAPEPCTVPDSSAGLARLPMRRSPSASSVQAVSW